MSQFKRPLVQAEAVSDVVQLADPDGILVLVVLNWPTCLCNSLSPVHKMAYEVHTRAVGCPKLFSVTYKFMPRHLR